MGFNSGFKGLKNCCILVFVMQVAIETKFSTPRLHALAVAVNIIFTAADRCVRLLSQLDAWVYWIFLRHLAVIDMILRREAYLSTWWWMQQGPPDKSAKAYQKIWLYLTSRNVLLCLQMLRFLLTLVLEWLENFVYRISWTWNFTVFTNRIAPSDPAVSL